MTRLRIERRRLTNASGGRVRRDPRAERLGISGPMEAAPIAEAIGPSGRIRRDPRAAHGPRRASPPPAPAAASLPFRPIPDRPEYLVLAVPELEDRRLSSQDRDLLGAARRLADAGHGAVVALASRNCDVDFASAGADQVLPAALPDGYAPENATAQILSAIKVLNPRHVLFTDGPTGGGDLGRRVAAALGEIPAVRVTRLSPTEVVSRGNGGRSDFLRSPPRILILAPETAEPAQGALWQAQPLPALETVPSEVRIGDGGLAATDPNALPLAEADFILSAGNGVSDWTAFHDLAAALGAAEGGSRVVCDAGLLPRSRQVGASGSLVEPRCYLAVGIAGATQHLQGITRCERVIAVNTDLHADMVKRADLAIIADAQAVMPALARLARGRLLKVRS